MDPRRRIVAAAAAISAFLVLVVFIAPYAAPYGTFRFDGGNAGFIEGWWSGNGAAGIPYALGDLLCHQQFDRSLVLNGSQLPVCIRDTGIAIGLAAGFSFCLLSERIRGNRIAPFAGVLLIALLPAEWLAETTGFDSAVLRMLSGICAGAGASVFLTWMLYRPHDR